jgi:DNA-binding NtrC family response regulator
MNLSNPILISDRSEDFRSLLRDMLTKHGFFHVLEASNEEETLQAIKQEKKPVFILIQQDVLNGELTEILSKRKNFIVIGQPDQPQTVNLAARLGVKHILNFPFSSLILLDKISAIAQ